MVPQEEGKRQSKGIDRNGKDRLSNTAQPGRGVLQADCSPEQGSLQHEGARPTYRGNHLVRHGLVAPDKPVSLFEHSSEKILVACPMKRRAKRLLERLKNALLQQHIARAPLGPVDHVPGRIGGPLVEPALYYPSWRLFLEVALDGA